MNSGMRSLWAPVTARQESRSLCASALTTIVLSEREKLAAGLPFPYSKKIALGVYTEKLVGPAPQFPAEMEQSINEYLQGVPVKTIAQR
jgi:hypothetical protein